MAYLQRGLTETELRERWRSEATLLSPERIVERFGKPPYYWLGETLPSVPYNDTPTYARQGRPLLVDQNGRQYTPLGQDDPMAANIRLPTGITIQQRSPRSTVPTSQLQAFPRIGETVTLVPATTAAAASSVHQHQQQQQQRMWVMRVRGIENARTATARILFHQRLPLRQDIESPQVAEQRDRALTRRLDGPVPALLQSTVNGESLSLSSSSSSASSLATATAAEGRALRRFLAMENGTATDDSNVSGLSTSATGTTTMSRKRPAQVALGV